MFTKKCCDVENVVAGAGLGFLFKLRHTPLKPVMVDGVALVVQLDYGEEDNLVDSIISDEKHSTEWLRQKIYLNERHKLYKYEPNIHHADIGCCRKFFHHTDKTL